MNPELLQTVLLGAAVLGAVGALLSFVGGNLYDGIGRGYLDVSDSSDGPSGASDAWNGDAALEIRQLIEARSALRRRHGKRPLDAEAELRAILSELER
jgi:hypothetical protein